MSDFANKLIIYIRMEIVYAQANFLYKRLMSDNLTRKIEKDKKNEDVKFNI